MKVIYILDAFPKISETFILNEILAIQKKGICVKVFAFSKASEDKVHPKVQKVRKITYFPKISFCKKIYAHFYWLIKNPIYYIKTAVIAVHPNSGIRKLFLRSLYDAILINKEKPDHIHAHFGQVASNMAMLIHLLTGIPYTFTTHRYDIVETPPRNYRIKSKLAKKHITISEYNKRYIIDNFGVEEDDIEVIHCGIDFSRKFPLAGAKGKNIIISIARLEKQKGLDNLLKACVNLKKQNIPFQCLIAGEGSERTILEKLIDDLGLRNEVKLLGNLTQDEVFELLSTAKIKVLPSRSESMGVALMEAMVCKVPVIGPQVMGVSELVEDEKCGFLVPPDDVNMLVEKIKVLLTDENLRMEFIENGYKKVFKEFNLEYETDKLVLSWIRSETA